MAEFFTRRIIKINYLIKNFVFNYFILILVLALVVFEAHFIKEIINLSE